MELFIRTPGDIVQLLCERLRRERLAQRMTQAELAQRAGVGVNTVSNLETGRNVGLENFIKVAMILGRSDELENLFQPKVDTLKDILRYEDSVNRQRVKKGPKDA